MAIERMQGNARMSAVVKVNGMVHLAGQVCSDITEDVAGQTRSTLEKIDGLLETAGSDRSQLVSATIYLRDIDQHFAAMNEVWDAWVPEGRAPARACVEARMARPQLLVEICVVAAVAD
jgi:enamine deaminase RidA (YjgF/YER057c/UK114 family)